MPCASKGFSGGKMIRHSINLVCDSAKPKRVSRIASIGPDMPRHQSQVSHEGFTACNGTAIPFLQVLRQVNDTHKTPLVETKQPCAGIRSHTPIQANIFLPRRKENFPPKRGED
jgi:hypothetical protein